jgi:hypothetical protein
MSLFHYCITINKLLHISFIFEKKMHCKCKADIRSRIIDQRILHVHVLDIICEMQCLETAFRSFVNRKSFHHIFASVLLNVYLCTYFDSKLSLVNDISFLSATLIYQYTKQHISCVPARKFVKDLLYVSPRVDRFSMHYAVWLWYLYVFIVSIAAIVNKQNN